jgi:hypothetical protein
VDEDTFWAVVDRARSASAPGDITAAARELSRQLVAFDDAELTGFAERLDRLQQRADCSALRTWLVLQGRAVFEQATSELSTAVWVGELPAREWGRRHHEPAPFVAEADGQTDGTGPIAAGPIAAGPT